MNVRSYAPQLTALRFRRGRRRPYHLLVADEDDADEIQDPGAQESRDLASQACTQAEQ